MSKCVRETHFEIGEIFQERRGERGNWSPLGTFGRRRKGKERLWPTTTRRMTWPGSGRRMIMFMLLLIATYIQSYADKAEISSRSDMIFNWFCSVN